MARYKFLNINPLGKKEQDCVCRAISLALNEDYYVIQEKIELVGKLFECPTICVCCYKFLLDNVYGINRIEEYNGTSIREFIEQNPLGTYIIRIEGHCTCVIDSICYDLWDCLDEPISLIWKVE